MKPASARLPRTFVAFALPIAIMTGLVMALRFGSGLSELGGLEYAPRVVALTSLFELAPGTCGAAALFALVTWGHEREREVIERELLAALRVVLTCAALGLLLVVPLCAGSGFLTAHWVFGVSWLQIAAARTSLDPTDLWRVAIVLALNLALAAAIAWVIVPRLARTKWSLLRKLALVWVGLAALRVLVSVV